MTDQDALPPHELERLAVDWLRVSRDASGILTSLFEEARYSDHPLGERDRARAIESLGQIQAALEARAGVARWSGGRGRSFLAPRPRRRLSAPRSVPRA